MSCQVVPEPLHIAIEGMKAITAVLLERFEGCCCPGVVLLPACTGTAAICWGGSAMLCMHMADDAQQGLPHLRLVRPLSTPFVTAVKKVTDSAPATMATIALDCSPGRRVREDVFLV